MKANYSGALTRRQFINLGALSVAACGVGLQAAVAAKKVPLGLQLYSVREQCAKDLPAVLKAVGAMGYKGVEYAGYYKRNAKELRQMMDDNGLVCCGTHTGMDTLEKDALEATLEFNHTLGNKYLIVPGMPEKRSNSKQAWLDTAKYFNELAARVKSHGMVVGYHAHAGDFKKIEEAVPWDLFFGNTQKSVVMQLDTGNCLDGGADPVAVLKKYPGRARTIHLKEHGGAASAVVGEGEVKWSEIFKLCEAGRTVDWYIVEHERGGPDPLGDVKRCLESLKKMGK